MNKLVKAHKKTDNAFFALKVAIRKEAIRNLPDVRVLDCFAGKNKLWKAVGFDYYVGIEKQKGKGDLNIHADNLRVIPSLDLNKFNVIDIDSYGIPANQLIALLKNTTLPKKIVIIFTAIGGAIANGQKQFIRTAGVDYEIYKKCPMLWNKHLLELFYCFLKNHCHVQKLRRIVMKTNAYEKHYGYFVLDSNAVV